MSRLKNDGRGRIGGRSKGSPNKPLLPVNEWVKSYINNRRNRQQFERDLELCTPQERAAIVGHLVASVISNNSNNEM